jgi:PAS domain S-box-containing protein
VSTHGTTHPAGHAGAGDGLLDAAHYRRQLETIARNATLALFIMDERQHCTYMNPAAEHLTGYTLAEVRGRALHDCLHHTRPDGTPYPLEECPIDRAFPENMREQGEEVFVHRDGHFYPVAFTASPIHQDGRTVGTIIEVRDITGEKRARQERERLLRELEVERARLASVFQRAPAFIATLRGPDHVFEMANPPYYQLVGHRDILGKPVREALPEVVEQGFIELLDGVRRSGEPFVGNEMRILLQREPGGGLEERFLNFVYQPLPDASGEVGGILAHGMDVTELVESRSWVEEQAAELEAQTEELQTQAQQMEEVQAELEISNEELQQANEQAARERAQLAAVIEHAPVGIVIAEAPSGRITAGNRRVEEIFRHPVMQSDTVDAYRDWVAYHPDGRQVEGHEYPLGRVFATGLPAGPDEYLYRRGDGTLAWVQITGAPIRDERGELTGGLVVIDDIDAEKRAEEERERLIADLETGQARLQQIFTEAPAVMALYSGPEHIVTMVNPTWEQTVGKPDAVGRPFREVFPEFEGSGLFEMLDRIYETGEPFVNPEVNVPLERWGSGVLEDTYWHLVWRPLAGDGAHGRDILVHAVEVTEQVRARREVERKADELGRLARQLEASNRELDQFAYVASHDLKAPLRGIANLSSWIEEDLGEHVTDEAREHLELLRGRVHRMEALIDGILQYSRAGRVREEPETVDVEALLREVVDLLGPPGHFAVRVAPGMPALVTERLPLQQVFMNLIGNAVKYNTDPDPWVEVSARDLGGAYEFSVADNGPGIAPEYHDRVFGIFQTLQARDKMEGTGIGLSLVKKLVERRGGRIRLESAEGAGAVFRFTWPTRGDDVTER